MENGATGATGAMMGWMAEGVQDGSRFRAKRP
ncbi:hypothetical protein POX_e06905 [Penicillium oxalicum]|uniref:Uncharacterized protein n=1 Tax=Penicillium oxalicum (strain 114-2 / CGMCC 5302) TaxID=933388 RepID=S7ZBH5_PENO1|nr:hypothetical protein POX_e06905 [Penicillium oxalicum]EPS27930.1 hypothetical protein PDE_02874 [Penicillium oxalicum 114-2]KAI2788881.1 hypothetical protein POX_e06905 [Penicillium oxalicum]